MTILIVDDHKLIRETWSFILNEEPGFKVIAGCGSAEEAIEIAKKNQPDIVILDVNLPGMSGLNAISEIQKSSPSSKILGVSMHTQPTYAREMIKRGAKGYLTKTSPKDEMLLALKSIDAGKNYICDEIRNKITDQLIHGNVEKGINDLSQRELEVVTFIKKGFSSKEIAEALFLSVKTVEVHRYNILKKLDLRNAASLINFMNRNYPDID
jgi:two-component system invasion response regulator UvrY